MQLNKYKKCGISYFTMLVLPLSKKDKEFLFNQDKNLLKNNKEYFELLKIVYNFNRSYLNAPLVQRFAIKESYQQQLQEHFNKFYLSQTINSNLKNLEIEK